MDIKIESEDIEEQQTQPLIENEQQPRKEAKTRSQKAIRKTLKGTSHLSSLLPSGSILIFEMFSPILTNQGQCVTFQAQVMTLCLITLVSLSCILMCFTDSIRDERGKVRYGIATFRGIWIVDGSVKLSSEEAVKYRIGVIDFLHAFMGLLVFMAVALLDQNVVKCLFPLPSQQTKERVLVMFPIGVAVVCGFLFICFPTKRNTLVSPLSKT
ncbi:protein DMP7-like [Spinacia oleracea]|uniref:Protein DMP7-like n=1 Tax=Spinacia oleracea TaxID=3562 RepID=A0A9R0J3B6_SPIOL|nr:protein DMP7-like [Spinacia oleracea]